MTLEQIIACTTLPTRVRFMAMLEIEGFASADCDDLQNVLTDEKYMAEELTVYMHAL